MESKDEINHSLVVSQDISQLFLCEALSDVVFVVEGKHIVAHKVVLAARSATFRELLFESTPLTGCKREIHINDCSALSFKNFVKYIYTGKLSLTDADENENQELLNLALKYQMKQLVESILEPSTGLACGKTVVSNKPQEISNKQKAMNKLPLRFDAFQSVIKGLVVIEGMNPETLFSGKKDLDEKCLTKHKIELNTKGLMIKLQNPVTINLVKFRLLDIEPKRYYSYYLQVATAGANWQMVADFRSYSCRSWQNIFFEPRSVQFIRIVGTNSNEKLFFSSSRYFAIVSFRCGLSQKPLKLLKGYWEPEDNIACNQYGSIVVINNGNDYCRNSKMLNVDIEFEYKTYNQIYSEFNFNRDSQLIIQLPQPIAASSLSFYIYGDDKYKYIVRVSIDSIDKEVKNWILVADRHQQFNSPNWQDITFNKLIFSLICIQNIRCLDESVDTLPIVSFYCPSPRK